MWEISLDGVAATMSCVMGEYLTMAGSSGFAAISSKISAATKDALTRGDGAGGWSFSDDAGFDVCALETAVAPPAAVNSDAAVVRR